MGIEGVVDQSSPQSWWRRCGGDGGCEKRMERHSSCTSFLRYLAFVVALLTSTIAFSMDAFLVYLTDLKVTFDFSQSEVGLMMAMEWLGLGVTLPIGVVIQRYGTRVSSAAALILSTGSNLLIWSAFNSIHVYCQYPALLAFYFFLAGCGCGTTYFTAITATVQNFEPRYRGTVVGVLASGCATGPLLFVCIYSAFFSEVHTIGNIQGYFLMLSLLFMALHICGLLLFGYYPPIPNELNERSYLIGSEPQEKKPIEKSAECHLQAKEETKHSVGASTPEQRKTGIHRTSNAAPDDIPCSPSSTESNRSIDEEAPVPFCQLIRDPIYHFIAWPAIIVMALNPMDTNNTSCFLNSFELMEYSPSFIYLGPAAALVCSISIGSVSDIVALRWSRGIITFVFAFALSIIFFLSAFLLDNPVVLALNIILLNISFPSTYCVTPVLLVERYGIQSLPLAWGLAHAAYGILSSTALIIMGVVYDLSATKDNNCYGLLCYEFTFLGAGSLALIGTGLSVLFLTFGTTARTWTLSEKVVSLQ